MSLFKRKNKKTETPACTCSNGCPAERKIYSVKVLGSGCKNCHALLEASQEAVRSMGLTVEAEYVTDMERIMEYGVMRMPALVVNEQVVSMGKVLKAGEIETLLKKVSL